MCLFIYCLSGGRANAVAEFSEVAKLQSLPFLRALILTGTLCVRLDSEELFLKLLNLRMTDKKPFLINVLQVSN